MLDFDPKMETGGQFPAVLVVAFNRPELLSRTLGDLRQAGPSRLYVNVDGPRPGVPEDLARVAQVREIVSSLEWPGPVFTRIVDVNRGLGQGVVEAISWFFENEDEGVILEDDVCISATSLELAGALLTGFRNDATIGSLTLFNPVPRRRLAEPDATYRLSRLPSSQYWATWRDRWQQLVPSVEGWRNSLSVTTLEEIGGADFARQFAEQLDEEVEHQFTAWEGLWIATHWYRNWNVVTTNLNYSRHIGFNVDASNSTEQPSWYPTTSERWDGVIKPPRSGTVDREADVWIVNQRFGLSLAKRAKHRIGQALPGLRSQWRRFTVRPVE